MAIQTFPRLRNFLVWGAIALSIAVPLGFAATSPLLAWRGPAYIVAGLAGVIAMALLLVQPLLATGHLPGLAGPRGRRAHRWIGGILVLMVVFHVAGLWITSPPDVVDALLFASPTPFSVWGVVAMWAVFATAVLAALRRRLRPLSWRRAHTALAIVIVAGSVVHALLIEGTMETISKAVLCALVVAATLKAVADLRTWPGRTR
ncbi:ferric reductase-like transmembrane domain-containing protein [Hoeflea sp. BAL378]|uniref:ferric reductase-like transmembrane domain-containing protein n=1 Tax=Hoeflea sp. BAL378 TaxID=1547437 RepID=UPI000A5D2832|nr:ferric reductase-like transmembrane domain-containing protein [Hoeflea sp. BAL378]